MPTSAPPPLLQISPSRKARSESLSVCLGPHRLLSHLRPRAPGGAFPRVHMHPVGT